jgi:hypothetical protein
VRRLPLPGLRLQSSCSVIRFFKHPTTEEGALYAPRGGFCSDRMTPWLSANREKKPSPSELSRRQSIAKPFSAFPCRHCAAKWAPNQSDILAIDLIGSHARRTATEESDMDLGVMKEAPRACSAQACRDNRWLVLLHTSSNPYVNEAGQSVSQARNCLAVEPRIRPDRRDRCTYGGR